jgi:hypothetical protein
MSPSKNLLYYSDKDKFTIVTKWDFFGKKIIGQKQDFVNVLMDVYLFIINITNMKEKEEETTSGPWRLI